MDMTAVMRKHSGRPFEPTGLDNHLCEKPRTFFANSEAHPEGPGVGGESTWWSAALVDLPQAAGLL